MAAAEADAEASADSNYDEEIAATEEAMAPERRPKPRLRRCRHPSRPRTWPKHPRRQRPRHRPETSIAPARPAGTAGAAAGCGWRPTRNSISTAHNSRPRAQPSSTSWLAKWAPHRSAPSPSSATPTASAPMPTTRSCPSGAPTAVKQYLAGRSVDADRMQAIGRGKSDPVTTPGCVQRTERPAPDPVPGAGPAGRNRGRRAGHAGTLIASALIHLKTGAQDTNLALMGATWFRRGSQSSSVHAKVQSPCKSAGNSIVANDDSYALAA